MTMWSVAFVTKSAFKWLKFTDNDFIECCTAWNTNRQLRSPMIEEVVRSGLYLGMGKSPLSASGNDIGGLGGEVKHDLGLTPL